ncbi:MAG: 2-C-methyl-D-erythritol 2,4-cyclodiphosphate synthase [Eubacteriales bacterium]
MRIGHGYDVHRFCDGDRIVIGGVKIPFEKGILAHSDGDVLVHAVADALLGAAGERDIGFHFPDTDEKYKNIDSMKLLSRVNEIIIEKGYKIENIDCTIIAQAPKMSPHIIEMRDNIAKTLCIDPDSVNVKATTEEKLGFTGRGEGIAAHCVCLLGNKERG